MDIDINMYAIDFNMFNSFIAELIMKPLTKLNETAYKVKCACIWFKSQKKNKGVMLNIEYTCFSTPP